MDLFQLGSDLYHDSSNVPKRTELTYDLLPVIQVSLGLLAAARVTLITFCWFESENMVNNNGIDNFSSHLTLLQEVRKS